MNPFSKKEYLQLAMPTEALPVSDGRRLRLALKALGYEKVTIPLPVLGKLYPLCREAGFDITVTLVHREYDWVVTDVEAGDRTGHHYGLAVDYGSTNILMELVDLNTGAVIAGESAPNGQIAFGTDILTRITYALEGPDRKRHLRDATLDTFHTLLSRLTVHSGIDASACPLMVVSGNTAMVHFLLELDAWTVFAAPFAPVTTDPGFLWGRELGMDFGGLVCFLPGASNYVGGDIISGLLTLDIHKREEPALFFDIGTNGELVIGNREWLLAGAGAAGPALEGYISKFGMRAQPGAVDSVRIRGRELQVTTIGGEAPRGICGSGILDLLAQLRRANWMDMAGNLDPEASEHIVFFPEEGQYGVLYARASDGTALYFSQTDIRQYLDTKAAAYTMVDCLLDTAGLEASDLDRCYLSGAFAAHSDLEAAITVGMFPDLPREKYRVLRNSSLDGARALLLDHALLEEGRHLAENIYCVQFASIPDFLIRMQAAKFLPHTDLSRFPSVQ